MLNWLKNNILLTICLCIVLLALGITMVRDVSNKTKLQSQTHLPPVALPASFTPHKGFLITTEDLSSAYAAGFRHFLVHFNFTSDNILVCMRNWQQDAPILFKLPMGENNKPLKKKLSYADFNSFPTTSGKRPCTLRALSQWLDEHKDAVIMAKVHNRPVIGFGKIKLAVPEFAKQIIPEAPKPRVVMKIHEMGYKQAILTVPGSFRAGNKTKMQKKELQNFLQFTAKQQEKIYALRLSGNFVKRGRIPNWLKTVPVALYASNVANCEEYKQLRERGISGMYGQAQIKAPCAKTQ